MSTAAMRWQHKLAFDCFKPEVAHTSSILQSPTWGGGLEQFQGLDRGGGSRPTALTSD